MVVSLRTGERLDASAAGFAVMAAAILAQDYSPPQVARQLGQLFRQGHRLVEVRQEVSERGSCHTDIIVNPNEEGLSLFSPQTPRVL